MSVIVAGLAFETNTPTATLAASATGRPMSSYGATPHDHSKAGEAPIVFSCVLLPAEATLNGLR